MPPRLLLVLAALLFSTGGAVIKNSTLTAWEIACFRSIVAAAAFWIAVPGVRQRWTPRLFAVGCAYASMLLLYVSSTKLTTAANSIFLQSTAPVYLLFLGPVLLKEPLRRSDWVLMAAMLLGLSLFFVSTDPASETAPNPALGNLLGAGSGVAWALALAGLRWMGREDKSGAAGVRTVFAGNLIAFVLTLAPAMPASTVTGADVATIVYLGVVQIGLAYYCLTSGMRHVPAFEASAILLIEPALNPVWTWLVVGERPGVLACLGGVILLCATGVNSWWQNRSREAAVT